MDEVGAASESFQYCMGPLNAEQIQIFTAVRWHLLQLHWGGSEIRHGMKTYWQLFLGWLFLTVIDSYALVICSSRVFTVIPWLTVPDGYSQLCLGWMFLTGIEREALVDCSSREFREKPWLLFLTRIQREDLIECSSREFRGKPWLTVPHANSEGSPGLLFLTRIQREALVECSSREFRGKPSLNVLHANSKGSLGWLFLTRIQREALVDCSSRKFREKPWLTVLRQPCRAVPCRCLRGRTTSKDQARCWWLSKHPTAIGSCGIT